MRRVAYSGGFSIAKVHIRLAACPQDVPGFSPRNLGPEE